MIDFDLRKKHLREKIYTQIETERLAQDKQFPENHKNNLAEWALIFTEEVGEFCQKACQAHFHMKGIGVEMFFETEVLMTAFVRYELLQAISVGVAIIEWLDMKGNQNEPKEESRIQGERSHSTDDRTTE